MSPPASESGSIPLWRSTPLLRACTGAPEIAVEHLFPSGRQAISWCLRDLGLGRADRVAIPEWSSACVVSAIGACSTPVPMREACEYRLGVAAILLYDQWGWPIPEAHIDRVRDRFGDCHLLLDKVDSPCLGEKRLSANGGAPFAEIWSLSKTLGLSGGGLVRVEKALVKPSFPTAALAPDAFKGIDDWAKSKFPAIPDHIVDYVRTNCVNEAFECEALRRKKNIAALIETAAAAAWPRWMHEALQGGAAPGIAPVFIGAETQDLAKYGAVLKERFDIESELYHFNVSGDPVSPRFEQCLAVPTHGDIDPERLRQAIDAIGPSSTSVNERMDRSVVVGGGIAGLAAARLIAERDQKVALVERDAELGGMLRSVVDDAGRAYDIGTHFILATGAPGLDAVLFDKADREEWIRFEDSLREGNYFCGRLDQKSGCIDAQLLDRPVFERGLAELVSQSPSTETFGNLGQQLDSMYGPTFAKEIFRPVMRKLTGSDLSELAPDMHRTFSVSRLIVANSETSRALKSSPLLDGKIAYARSEDGTSNITKYYPRFGGVGGWVESLAERSGAKGTEFLLGQSVKHIEVVNRRVKSLQLTSGDELPCDYLVWTLPAATFLHVTGNKAGGTRPDFRQLFLLHLAYDTRVLSDCHWITCYEPDFLTYRVTLYPNIVGGCSSSHHLTVEVLLNPQERPEGIEARVQDELVEMGIVKRSARVVSMLTEQIQNALPITTPDMVASNIQNMEAAQSIAENVAFVGRASGSHFQIDILKDVDIALAAQFGPLPA